LTLEALLDDTLEGLGFYPNLLYWSYENNIAKPALEFYQPAAKVLSNAYDIEEEEVLYVGNDLLNDIYPADQLGFKTALFAGDNRSLKLREEDERTSDLTPDLIFTRFSQLQDCLT
jgi:putative hydrolase of the HAD superfamily